jgi:hypothetical protein
MLCKYSTNETFVCRLNKLCVEYTVIICLISWIHSRGSETLTSTRSVYVQRVIGVILNIFLSILGQDLKHDGGIPSKLSLATSDLMIRLIEDRR